MKVLRQKLVRAGIEVKTQHEKQQLFDIGFQKNELDTLQLIEDYEEDENEVSLKDRLANKMNNQS